MDFKSHWGQLCINIFIAVVVSYAQGQDIANGLVSENKPLDVYFLADNTGSMKDEISMVASRARFLFDQLAASTTENIRFGVGAYRDFGDDFVFQNLLALTEENLDLPVELDPIVQSMNSWSAIGGGDDPEAQLYALYQIGTKFYEQIGWRGNAVKIVVWFGDAPGHDPSGEFIARKKVVPITEQVVIEVLTKKDIRVSAIDVDRLDLEGQASRISNSTGGTYSFYSRDQTEFESISSVEGSFESIGRWESKASEDAFLVPSVAISRISAPSVVAVDTMSDGSGKTTGFIDTIISSVEQIFAIG
eukprot:TRINITY_DN2203_c0_g1_i1.p1 TRINITY_DN2203_c0_g1~~TRINITY_DN2203_c0_g1_i1.p1  ORF type:complete len:357 (+),score=44.92 TRINITY_DN2203_c0_g1_i1:161-1072(+)